jgi:hypothetical protein
LALRAAALQGRPLTFFKNRKASLSFEKQNLFLHGSFFGKAVSLHEQVENLFYSAVAVPRLFRRHTANPNPTTPPNKP